MHLVRRDSTARAMLSGETVVRVGSAPGSGAHDCRAGAAILRSDAAGAWWTRDGSDCSTYC